MESAARNFTLDAWRNDRSDTLSLTSVVRRALGVLLTGGLAFTALALLIRRISGALESCDSAALLAAVGAAIGGAAMIAHGCGLSEHWVERTKSAWPRAVISLATLAAGLALSTPGSSALGLCLLWALLAGAEVVGWQLPKIATGPGVAQQAWGKSCRGPCAGNARRVPRSPAPLRPAPLAAGVIQQLVRRRGLDGSDELEGLVRATFVAGDRTSVIHVAFCPPFARSPEINLEQIGGPTTRLKQGPAYPFGVRIEVKRTGDVTSERSDIVLRLTAKAAAAITPSAGDSPKASSTTKAFSAAT